MPQPDVEVRIDASDLSGLLRDAKAFDTKLATALRKRLRGAAQDGVKDVKRRLMGRTFKTDAGLARGIGAGLKVSVRSGKRNAGVSIRATGSGLPAAKQAMVRAYNKPSFRHPVYGNRDVWAVQRGRPYFGAVLYEKKHAMQSAVEDALHDAAATIRAGRVR